jgi:hypothetical protein
VFVEDELRKLLLTTGEEYIVFVTACMLLYLICNEFTTCSVCLQEAFMNSIQGLKAKAKLALRHGSNSVSKRSPFEDWMKLHNPLKFYFSAISVFLRSLRGGSQSF